MLEKSREFSRLVSDSLYPDAIGGAHVGCARPQPSKHTAMVAGNASRPLPPVNQSSPLMAKRPPSSSSLDAGGPSSAAAEEGLASPSARRSRSAGSAVHWATSDPMSDPAPTREPSTPEISRQRTPSMAILHAVRDAIERHPSFAQKIGLQIVPPTTASADAWAWW